MTQDTLSELRELLAFHLSSLNLILFNYEADPSFLHRSNWNLKKLKKVFKRLWPSLQVPQVTFNTRKTRCLLSILS